MTTSNIIVLLSISCAASFLLGYISRDQSFEYLKDRLKSSEDIWRRVRVGDIFIDFDSISCEIEVLEIADGTAICKVKDAGNAKVKISIKNLESREGWVKVSCHEWQKYIPNPARSVATDDK